MTAVVRLVRDTYLDSVVQLSGTRAMNAVDGVDWAAAAMATEANLATLTEQGFDPSDWSGATAGDLVLAVRADTDDTAAAAEQAGRDAMFAARPSTTGDQVEADPPSVQDAVGRLPGSSVAVISVPGDYAALETHKALSAGLQVLLFSDNVPIDDEVELKERATELGLLVMGPGAGTAMLGGTCLGFANVMNDPAQREHTVAVVAAAGTGAQEAAALLDRFGVGVTDVIGLGGRDLSKAVGGPMGRLAVRSLAAAGDVDAILLVSKPPDPDVARSVLAETGSTPLVASLIGLSDAGSADEDPPSVSRASTLEGGVLETLRRLGRPVPDTSAGLAARVDEVVRDLPAGRTLVRGLFSGGTLCYESLVLLERALGPVYSNTPIDKSHGLPAPEGAHVCLDLGEEEYTQGRPHPMIDPEARVEHLRAQGAEPDVAVILLDVVLGYGAHPDPAAELGPVCRDIIAGGGPRIVVYVLGTDKDPQGFERQRAAFTDAGCVVAETAARASLAAAAIALRDSSIVGQQL
ncbi:protein FdrA [Pseudonocardia endophytica]|uniref:Succinyl-CoA synthetase alpha subunit n=1 Tax=Pseudonocardia endophytica TaxID=401976 RepID=A0A4R1HPF0_PSEEN|nr:protein FdrA [Pseudonocardia endophytica]TCK24427.1 succinyl-CoA synthetase alpha subunit [Pseudonocardia endophytica]